MPFFSGRSLSSHCGNVTCSIDDAQPHSYSLFPNYNLVFLERRQTVEGPELLTRPEVALYLRTPTTTLAQWASRGIGPHYTKVGRKTLYRRADLERWFQEQESAQRGEPVG